MLAITLFLSVFTLGNYATGSQSREQQTVQTEQLWSDRYRPAKRIISYGAAFTPGSRLSVLKNNIYETNSLQLRNRLDKVKFDHLSIQSCTFESAGHLMHIHMFSPGADDDIFSVVAG